MEIDATTYSDLSLFSHEEEFSIFHKLDFTRTRGGRDQLLSFFNQPFSNTNAIRETQQIQTLILQNLDNWPTGISNGTLMVMDRFYETPVDDIPPSHNLPAALGYKIFHSPDYALVRYSIGHFADFVRGMYQLTEWLDKPESPPMLSALIDRARKFLDQDILRSLAKTKPGAKLTLVQVVHYGHFIRERLRTAMEGLIAIYYRLDAWYSMAMSVHKYRLTFPIFADPQYPAMAGPQQTTNADPQYPAMAGPSHADLSLADLSNADLSHADPFLAAQSLYHLLLPDPVSYDVQLTRRENFLFLTGANMAGKSTFIRAVGVSVFLAHIGMGVPAASMRLSLFDGILSNINVVDNISKGESFFFNEVQRIRDTLIKISGQRKWLVLIDELFKGTNMQDAMKCSSVVIKGLIRISRSLFILSTHLYEIGEELREFPNISFRYFETTVQDDQLQFSYQLKEGISNDRIGYLILKREKVVDMLEKL